MPNDFPQGFVPDGFVADEDANKPRLTPDQIAAQRLTGGRISDSGLRPGPPVLQMKESLAPKLVRTGINTALPAVGAIAGGALAAPSVAGAALGAGVGTGLGVEGAQLLNRGIFGESERDPNPASLPALKSMGTQALTAAGTAGVMYGLSGAPLRMPKASSMQVFGPAEEHAELNEIIGAKPKQIRISREAEDIGEAATNPGRGLRTEGFEAQPLQQMTPVERMAAIKPKLDKAGAAIDDLVAKATEARKIVDVGKTATETLGKIADPKLQEQAIGTFNNLAKELGIENLRTATPEEALVLRRALGSKARFQFTGDLSSLASVRAALYRSVNRDLRAVVPNLQPLDQHFSDLNAAIEAVQAQVGKAAVKAPLPLPAGPGPGPTALNQVGRGLAQQGARMIVRKVLPPAIGMGAGDALYRGLRDRFSP